MVFDKIVKIGAVGENFDAEFTDGRRVGHRLVVAFVV